MKNRLSIWVLIMMMVTLTACGGSNGAETGQIAAETVEKDVSMLLKGIGDSLDMVKSLGDLPEAQVNGNLYYYQNAQTEGYFAGFDLGIETEADGKTVKQIYIQPIGEAKITANGIIAGGTIEAAKAALGNGELSSLEQKGKIVNFMTFTDEAFSIKATVEDQKVVAVAFTRLSQAEGASTPAGTAEKVDGKKDEEVSAGEKSPKEDSSEVQSSAALSETYMFDVLLAFLGQDFSLVENEMGSDYERVEEAYEDVVVYREGKIQVMFAVDYDTNTVFTVGINFDSLNDTLDGEIPAGLAGNVLGSHAEEANYNQALYGDYDLYVSTDVNNVLYSIQVTEGHDSFSFEKPLVMEPQEEEGYELSIENFDSYSILKLTYNGSGETIELVNTKGRWDGDPFFDGSDVKILKAEASEDGKTVYFETDDPKMTNGYGAANNSILKYDIEEGYEENVCLGFLYDTVKVPGYEDCIIIEYIQPSPRGGYYKPYVLIDGETNYHYMGKELESDLADQVRQAYQDQIDELAVMTPASENINGKYIDFSKYSIVVAEDYKGINTGRMESMTIQNPYYKDQGQALFPCNFAVFGTVFNLRWEVGINMDESKVYPIADQLTDTLVTYETWRPYDPSIDTFWFEDVNGNEYRIVIEDMSDNIDLVTVP